MDCLSNTAVRVSYVNYVTPISDGLDSTAPAPILCAVRLYPYPVKMPFGLPYPGLNCLQGIETCKAGSGRMGIHSRRRWVTGTNYLRHPLGSISSDAPQPQYAVAMGYCVLAIGLVKIPEQNYVILTARFRQRRREERTLPMLVVRNG